MIVRFNPSGRSFKWLAEYLLHDPQAQTSERVAWSHTLNLAHDDGLSAVHEMIATFHNRDLLKAEAGVRAGGAKLEKPVKHVSLSWHPSEKPSKAEMIAATTSFLKAMGWGDFQCLFVAHDDRKFQHVHLMINAAHPLRGTRLDDGFERRRAQGWALHYEQERGKVFCEERLQPEGKRSPSPPRNVWEKLRRMEPGESEADVAYEESDSASGRHPQSWQRREWMNLKGQQKKERLAFFEGGKRAYRSLHTGVYQDVRSIYSKEWKAFYALSRSGAPTETIVALRADLLARQGATLDARCMVAVAELRKDRDAFYRALLDGQKNDRAELADRQERGLSSPHLSNANSGSATDLIPTEQAGATVEEARRRAAAEEGSGGLHWTHRGGMVAQQHSARRWLDRAADRLGRSAPEEKAAPRSPLATAADRLTRKEPGKKESGVRMAIEPDG